MTTTVDCITPSQLREGAVDQNIVDSAINSINNSLRANVRDRGIQDKYPVNIGGGVNPSELEVIIGHFSNVGWDVATDPSRSGDVKTLIFSEKV